MDLDDIFAILEANKFDKPAAGFASWAEGDYNGDDLVNSTDPFLILGTGLFNAGPYSSSSLPAAVAVVPEPSGFVLAAFGLLGLLVAARYCCAATEV